MNVRGNRFNVLFYNAAGIYFFRKHIIFYLSSSKSTLNVVQNCFLCALQNNFILCISKALGILCRVLTEPYWRKTDEVKHAVTMGSVYRRMLDFLDSCTTNPYLLIKREISLFYGPSLPCSDVEDILYESFNADITCSIIKKFCSLLKVKLKNCLVLFYNHQASFLIHQMLF